MNDLKLLFTGFPDLPKRARNLLIALEFTLFEIQIAQTRIRVSLDKITAPNKISRLTERRKAKRLLEDDLVYETLMADIHLWIVAWGNVNKLLRNLRETVHDPKLDWIQERRKRWFLTIRDARNSLEHMDERTVNSESRISPIEDLYVEYQNKRQINVFGTKVKFDDATFNKLTNLKKDLYRWHSKLPSIFGAITEKHGWTISDPE